MGVFGHPWQVLERPPWNLFVGAREAPGSPWTPWNARKRSLEGLGRCWNAFGNPVEAPKSLDALGRSRKHLVGPWNAVGLSWKVRGSSLHGLGRPLSGLGRPVEVLGCQWEVLETGWNRWKAFGTSRKEVSEVPWKGLERHFESLERPVEVLERPSKSLEGH